MAALFHTSDLSQTTQVGQLSQSLFLEESCRVKRSDTQTCGSLSPLWGCNLALVRQAFIESSVVKLDYGKVSTTDVSSFDIPLWYTELQEMI